MLTAWMMPPALAEDLLGAGEQGREHAVGGGLGRIPAAT
jgi:hypothetical protein